MADNKRSREKQAQDADRRQRQRDVDAQRERGDEPEPPLPPADLKDVESALGEVSFPVTGAELVAAVGDREIESPAARFSVAELVPDTEEEVYDSPAAVRAQVERPTVAAAMKRVTEACATLPNTEFPYTQRKAYERTFEALTAIDAADHDEGVTAVTDWVVEQIRQNDRIPGSRAVRREAAKFCRSNGYQVRVDEWLGI